MSFCRQCGNVVDDQASQCAACSTPTGSTSANANSASIPAFDFQQFPPFQYYLQAFKPYANFNGRSHRPAFWFFTLFNWLIYICLSVFDNLANLGPFVPGLALLYSLATLIPALAISVRRLHDIGQSGWFCLLALIPVLGWIALLILFCMPSNPGDNKYGPPCE